MDIENIKVGNTYYTNGGVLLVDEVKHVLTANGPEYFLECSDHLGNTVYIMPECVLRLYC